MIQGRPPPPPLKMAILCPKMPQKCHFWAKNSVFLARVVSWTAAHPISQVLHSNEHVLQEKRPGKWVNQGRPPLKKGHFCPKKGIKIHILGQKQCFLATGGDFNRLSALFHR